MTVLPSHRAAIHDAMTGLATQPEHMRTLSHFMDTVQEQSLREALAYYTQRGAMGMLLDARTDNLRESTFTVFEMEELMKKGDRNLIPVLLYIFHRIEKALDGKPALLILDEAWIMLGHPVFRSKIREWLKVLRKANCGVILATQSLSDARQSGIMSSWSRVLPRFICRIGKPETMKPTAFTKPADSMIDKSASWPMPPQSRITTWSVLLAVAFFSSVWGRSH